MVLPLLGALLVGSLVGGSAVYLATRRPTPPPPPQVVVYHSRGSRCGDESKEEEKGKGGAECRVCDARGYWLDHLHNAREIALLLSTGGPKGALETAAQRISQSSVAFAEWLKSHTRSNEGCDRIAELLDQQSQREVHLAQAYLASHPSSKSIDELQKKHAEGARELARELYRLFPSSAPIASAYLVRSMEELATVLRNQIRLLTARQYKLAIAESDEAKGRALAISDSLVRAFRSPLS